MATKLSQYYKEIENTIFLFDTALSVLENKLSLSIDDDTDLLQDNYSDAIFQLQNAVNKLEILDNIHKFERISKTQMQYLFSSYDAGLGGAKIIIDIEHIITSYDTTRTIERKYNIAWQKIQEYNNIVPSQLVPLMILRIPIEVDLNSLVVDVPTFGDQQGNDILGTDLPNELAADEDGDLKVLSNEDSFAQSVNNYFTMLPGSLPYYEEVGFDPKVSDNYNQEEKDSILQLRVMNALADDKRIRNVTISDAVKKDITQKLSLIIEAISGNQTTITI